jgi:tRNA-specific 2-thiouridylase
VGEYTKPAIRQLARDFKLPVAEREESQDLCFIADDDYRRFVRERAPDGAIQPGPISLRDGAVLGQHQGLPNYTIGQRKGIGIAGPEALYVVGMRPETNTLIVGPARELGRDRLLAGGVNWISGQAPSAPIRAEVKIRYKAQPAWATLTPIPERQVLAQFEHPLRDITPGQGAVFYEGEVCLGGGIIQRADT